MSHPLLFLDVDGPLIPFGGPVPEYPLPREFRRNANPLLARVNPDLGPELLHRVDHRAGLTPADFALLTAWLGGR